MPTWLKILLIIGGSIFVILLLIIGAGAYWWSQHKDEFVEAGKRSITEGKEFGKGTDNEGCLSEAISRYKQQESFSGTISAKLFLKTCLESSRPTPGFCDPVPKTTEIMKSAQWQVEQCRQAGLSSSQYCGQIFQEVQSFCESGQSKLK
jgi:hypothetical protein